MEKLLPFASDNQKKTFFFVLLVFYSQPSSYSLYFHSFLFSSRLDHSVFFLLSLFTPLLCFPFSFSFFPRPVKIFTVERIKERTLLHIIGGSLIYIETSTCTIQEYVMLNK